MKIRIKGNSVRFRLTRPEVDKFDKEGYIEERTEFGTSVLVYALQKSDEGNLNATFENGKVTMLVPNSIAEEWTETDQVGFDRRMVLGENRELYLLVEKDFKCLDETSEDQSDNYDNPLASK